jgi:tetratricopeptide (TPR) repeat protein
MQGIIAIDDYPPRIAGYLSAAALTHDWREAESLLLRAMNAEPDCLHVYYTLYKLYATRNRLGDAEKTALMALDVAARQANISAEWSDLTKDACDWAKVNSPQHFYLFSLKALAFIRLRQQRVEDAKCILAKLHEIDPNDSVGASVIEAYADGVPA